MRTLKKVLAVVLALAMVLGMAVTASATYDDAAAITEKEAVEVLGALNVMIGSGNKFNPAGTLTRAEAAVLVAKLCLGDDAEDLTAVQMFSDVDATNWAAKYVAYCATEGIVVGVGNGKFNPTGKLTGTEFALMLLATLGYDAKIELTGANWAEKTVQIAALAKKAGLTSKSLKTTEITREEAAKLCFNALKANCVEYETKGTTITVGGVEIVTGASKATAVVNNAKKETYKDDDKLQLAESLYGTDLVYTKTTTDAFGRPAHEWKYETKKIGTYTNKADLAYTAAPKVKEIYADLDLSKATPVVFYVNGVEKDLDIDYVAKNDSTKVYAVGDNAGTGESVAVEVYYDATTDTQITVCVIPQKVAQVDAVVAAKGDDKAYIKFGSYTFETEDFDEDEWITYTYSEKDDAVKSVAATTKVSGIVTSSSYAVLDYLDSVVVDGKTYKTMNEYKADVQRPVSDKKTSYDFYLDTLGNIAYLEESAFTSSDYALLLETSNSALMNRAKIVLADGTVKNVETAKDYKANHTGFMGANTNTNAIANNTVVAYKVEDGVYTLKAVRTVDQGHRKFNYTSPAAYVANGYVAAEKLDSKDVSEEILGNSKTIFVVKKAADKDWTVYTGVANMPTIKNANDAWAYVKSADGFATIVFIDAVGAQLIGENSNVFIAYDSTALAHTDEVVGQYYIYNAVVDGEIKQVKVSGSAQVKKNYAWASATYSDEKITSLTQFGSGDDVVYEGFGVERLSGDYSVKLKTADGTNKFLGSYAVFTLDEDAKIFYVDKDHNITEVTKIATDDNDRFVAVVANDRSVLKALYVQEVSDTVNPTVTFKENNAAIAHVTVVSNVAADGTIVKGTDLTFKLTAKTGYVINSVKNGSTPLVADENGLYTVKSLKDPCTIEITTSVVVTTAEKTVDCSFISGFGKAIILGNDPKTDATKTTFKLVGTAVGGIAENDPRYKVGETQAKNYTDNGCILVGIDLPIKNNLVYSVKNPALVYSSSTNIGSSAGVTSAANVDNNGEWYFDAATFTKTSCKNITPDDSICYMMVKAGTVATLTVEGIVYTVDATGLSVNIPDLT